MIWSGLQFFNVLSHLFCSMLVVSFLPGLSVTGSNKSNTSIQPGFNSSGKTMDQLRRPRFFAIIKIGSSQSPPPHPITQHRENGHLPPFLFSVWHVGRGFAYISYQSSSFELEPTPNNSKTLALIAC